MENKIKRYHGVIGLVLVIALIVCMFPISSMAGDEPEETAINTDQTENQLIVDGDNEVVGDPEVDKNEESTPAAIADTNIVETNNVKTNSIDQKSVALGTQSVDGLVVGEKLGAYFPDSGFAKYVYEVVLKSPDGASADPQDYPLTADDISKIKSHTTISISDTYSGGAYNSLYGIKKIDGVKYFENLTNISINQYSNYTKNAPGLTEIPAEINSLNKLKSLTLGYGDLTEIPDLSGIADTLTTLNLQYNKINKGVENCYELENLQNLYFIGNHITEIPEGISNLTKLGALSFAFNRIKVVPEEVWKMTHLWNLALANNEISNIDGVSNLNRLTIFTIANNNISDFSELYGKCPSLNFSGNGNLQTSGQIKYASEAIKVPAGATSADVDIRNYEFKYCANGYRNGDNSDKVTVYDKLELGVAFYQYDYYPQLALPNMITHHIGDATKDVDRVKGTTEENTFKLKIDTFEKADGTKISAVILRMQAPDAIKEVDGRENWTSFFNCDITYIIPIAYEEETPVVKGDDATPVVTTPTVLGEEAKDDASNDDGKVLGEEAKTADQSNAMTFMIVLIAALGIAMVLVTRRMSDSKK